MIKSMKNDGKDFDKYHKTLTKCVNKLVKVRNEIFNAQAMVKEVVDNSEEYNLYSKQDVVNSFEVINKLKNTDSIKNHNLWDIPIKTHTKDTYDNGEMTE